MLRRRSPTEERRSRRDDPRESVEAYAIDDFHRDRIDAATLERWIAALGDRGVLVNRRGTTWRRFDEAANADLDERRAIELTIGHPSIIATRAMLVRGRRVLSRRAVHGTDASSRSASQSAAKQ